MTTVAICVSFLLCLCCVEIVRLYALYPITVNRKGHELQRLFSVLSSDFAVNMRVFRVGTSSVEKLSLSRAVADAALERARREGPDSPPRLEHVRPSARGKGFCLSALWVIQGLRCQGFGYC